MNYKHIYRFTFAFLLAIQAPVISKDQPLALKKMTKGADLILTGKVTEKSSGWNKSKTRIYTTVTLKVDEFIKGNKSSDFVEVEYPGGEVGEIGELYSHMPNFKSDEEVLVFLKKNKENSSYQVFNGEEGKITALNDSKTPDKGNSKVRFKVLKSQINALLK